MKKLSVAFLLSIVIFSLVGPMPSVLANADSHERTGERFNLFSASPLTFQAGEPLHFAHGWNGSPSVEHPLARLTFQLEVDGVPVDYDFIERSGGNEGVLILRVYNFPQGLPAGTYTFTGYWSGPCRAMVDLGNYPGPCANPTESVIVLTLSMTVEFLP